MASRPYPRFKTPIDPETMTQQHFTQQVNVNNIVEAYSATGVDLYAENKATEKYGNVPSKTYFEALCEVKEFESSFNELPQHIREQFNNDPHAYLQALEQPISENTTPDKGSQEIAPPEASQEASAPQDSTPPKSGAVTISPLSYIVTAGLNLVQNQRKSLSGETTHA